MKRWLFTASLCAIVSACGGGSGPSGLSAEFTQLDLPAGATSAWATAVSADGSTVGGTAEEGAGNRAIRWSAGGPESLGVLPDGTHSELSGLSADGSVAVGSGDSRVATATAFRWTMQDGMQPLPFPPSAVLCNASGTSGDGNAVIGVCLAAGDVGFRWTADAGTVSLGRFGTGTGGASAAMGISRDGALIVGRGQPSVTGAMAWSADLTPIFIGKLQPDDASAQANAASRDGSVVAGSSTSSSNVSTMFIWRQAGMLALPGSGLTAPGDWAAALSGDGHLLVGWAMGASSDDDQAIIWTARQGTQPLLDVLKRDYQLSLPGWKLLRASAVSDNGLVIVGRARNPQGQLVAWRVRLSSAPV